VKATYQCIDGVAFKEKGNKNWPLDDYVKFLRFSHRTTVTTGCAVVGHTINPALPSKRQPRKAVLVASAAMPGFLIPLTTGAARALRVTAKMLGAEPVDHVLIGLAAGEPHTRAGAADGVEAGVRPGSALLPQTRQAPRSRPERKRRQSFPCRRRSSPLKYGG
jgi:hypothetical protein